MITFLVEIAVSLTVDLDNSTQNKKGVVLPVVLLKVTETVSYVAIMMEGVWSVRRGLNLMKMGSSAKRFARSISLKQKA